ncbi:MAG: Gfo/Idh/MocA family oxidoreductase [Acidobacteria bacterium]|nr:Gfo/Idh/MocA family oxidoreductase [Acidobacteriota bacterium]
MSTDRRAFLKSGFAAAALAANDRPQFGLIGSGIRGRFLSQACRGFGAQCVAVCDVYEPNLQRGLKDAPQAKSYVDYHDLLAQPGIDFVVVATPDHHHCPNLLDALAAGKDVYLEKPMSHSLEESAKMVAAVRKTDRIVQIGMHRRSSDFMFRAKKVIDDGMLGRITLVHTRWKWNFARPISNAPIEGKLDWERFQGPAERRDFQPRYFRRWRSFWAYSGGNSTDQGTHLMDVIQWFTNSSTPKSAVMIGQLAKMQGGEVPDVFTCVFDYPKFIATFTLNYSNDYQTHWSFEFQGDRATLLIDDQGFTVFEEPTLNSISTRAWWNAHSKPLMQVSARVVDEDHVKSFLECIRTRKEPPAPVEVGARAVAPLHLANIAYREGRKANLAPDGVRVS